MYRQANFIPLNERQFSKYQQPVTTSSTHFASCISKCRQVSSVLQFCSKDWADRLTAKRKWVQHSCTLLANLDLPKPSQSNFIWFEAGKSTVQIHLCELNREPGDFRYNQDPKLFSGVKRKWKTQHFLSRTSYPSREDTCTYRQSLFPNISQTWDLFVLLDVLAVWLFCVFPLDWEDSSDTSCDPTLFVVDWRQLNCLEVLQGVPSESFRKMYSISEFFYTWVFP